MQESELGSEFSVCRKRASSDCNPFDSSLSLKSDSFPLDLVLVRRHSFSSYGDTKIQTKSLDFTEIFDKMSDHGGYSTPHIMMGRFDSAMLFEFPNPLDRVPSFLLESEERSKHDCSRVVSRWVYNAFENPDGKVTYLQATFIMLHSIFEVYRAIISSFLTVFVPQRCPDGLICSIYDNVVPRDQLESIAIGFNAFMAFYFCTLYLFECVRERRVQSCLAIAKEAPTSKTHLVDMLCKMDRDIRGPLLRMNNVYRLTGIYMMMFFFVNSGLSWAVVYKNYLDNTTFITFTTNALFMVTKLYGVLKITSSGEYNIYSAYLNDYLVYNTEKTKTETETETETKTEMELEADLEIGL
jgi:hypothetical protein